MVYHVQIEKRVLKQIKSIPFSYQEKILRVIDSLAREPFQGKKLEGKLKGQYSVRVWPYRIVYSVYKKELIVIVIDVAHRQGVYRGQ